MPKVPHGRQQHQAQISLFYDKGIHYLITKDYFFSFSTNQRLSLPTPNTMSKKKTIKGICLYMIRDWPHKYAFTLTDMLNIIDWFEVNDTSLITPNMKIQIKLTNSLKKIKAHCLVNKKKKTIAKAGK
jgi:hypothetical protein